MVEQCICVGSPDAVDKINWKCVECKRDLKADIERVFAERELEVAKKAKAALEVDKGNLTSEQIQDRRDMNDE